MSIHTIRSGATAHPEKTFLQFITDLVDSSGVLGANDLLVTEQSPQALGILVKAGRAYVTGESTYPVIVDGDESVSITNNSSSDDRIDTVVLYIDLVTTPNSDATNVAKIEVVEGTPSASPTPPTDADIQSAIGGTNPYVKLANVYVASGASSISDSDITDLRSRVKVIKAGNNIILDTEHNTDGTHADVTLSSSSDFRAEHNADGTHGDVTLSNSSDFLVEHNADGTHDTSKVAMLTASQTLTNKTLTSPVINTSISGSALTSVGSNASNKICPASEIKTYVDGSIAGTDYVGGAQLKQTFGVSNKRLTYYVPKTNAPQVYSYSGGALLSWQTVSLASVVPTTCVAANIIFYFSQTNGDWRHVFVRPYNTSMGRYHTLTAGGTYWVHTFTINVVSQKIQFYQDSAGGSNQCTYQIYVAGWWEYADT